MTIKLNTIPDDRFSRAVNVECKPINRLAAIVPKVQEIQNKFSRISKPELNMDECRSVAKFLILSAFVGTLTCAASLKRSNDLTIVEDVIADVENSTQKVIRVNPVDLPPIVPTDDSSGDSSLYKIQTLLSPASDYVSSKKFRKQKNMSSESDEEKDSPIIRQFPEMMLRKPKRPKLKQLHLLYNQQGVDGQTIGKRMKVRLAPGAYPIYYVVAKSNGGFRKQPIKGFRNELELNKYFDKVEKIGKLNAIGS